MVSNPSYLIITSMKNEASFILEWVAYHRVIGFTDFLVYTNDCEDGTVEMLERLEELGVVTHKANKVLKRGPQKSALKDAKTHPLVEKADWIYVADIDEFLVVKQGDGSVQALIDAMPEETDVIPVTWRLFGHNDQVDYVDRPVIEQFTDAERPLSEGGFPDRFVKSLFRRHEDVERFGTHGPIAGEDFVWRQSDGRLLGKGDNLTRPARAFAYDVAQINHYAVGSVDMYLVKKDRGRVNHWRQDMGLDYWRRLCRGGSEDRSILTRLEATKAEMARLMEDDVLRQLHDEGVAWRQARIAELKERRAFARMRRRILELSKAGDHLRRFETKPKSDAPKQDEVLAELKSLCSDMRALVDHLAPHEAAENALELLDDMETGLFGKGGK